MLEIEISRFTGLILVETIEIVSIIAVIMAMSGIILTLNNSYKQSLAISADFSFKMAQIFRQPRFSITLNYLETGKIPTKDWNIDYELEVLLTHIEDIGLFVSDGIIKEHHVLEMYSYTLEHIKKSSDCKRIIEKYQRVKPNFYFMYVKKLLNRV